MAETYNPCVASKEKQKQKITKYNEEYITVL